MADDSSSEDSDMCSSAPSSSCSSSEAGGDSPRSGGDSHSGPSVRCVPPLSLRANLAALPRGDIGPEAPAAARPQLAVGTSPRVGAPLLPASQQASKPPRLPALALGVLPSRASAPQPLSLDILSPAFSLEQQQQEDSGAGDVSQLAHTCAGRLGVPLDRLRFYMLTEVAGTQQLPWGCSRAAVEVLDSRFSLSALEELVAENQRLAGADKVQGRQEQPLPEMQQLQGRMQMLQAENDTLRAQLKRSETLRRKGAQALQELQQEFKALSQELMKGSALGMVQQQQQPQPEYEHVKADGTPVAVVDGLLENGDCDG